jgi:translation initiation factor IF-1
MKSAPLAWRRPSGIIPGRKRCGPRRYQVFRRPFARGEREWMSKDDLIQLQGEVVHVGKGGNFRVQCENGHEVLAKLSGHTRRHRIRVVLGDRVTVAVSPYDPSRGFIVYRER